MDDIPNRIMLRHLEMHVCKDLKVEHEGDLFLLMHSSAYNGGELQYLDRAEAELNEELDRAVLSSLLGRAEVSGVLWWRTGNSSLNHLAPPHIVVDHLLGLILMWQDDLQQHKVTGDGGIAQGDIPLNILLRGEHY